MRLEKILYFQGTTPVTKNGFRFVMNHMDLKVGDWVHVWQNKVVGWHRNSGLPIKIFDDSLWCMFLESNNEFIGYKTDWSEKFTADLVYPADDLGDTGTWSYITMAYSSDRVSTVWVAYGDDNSAPIRFKIKTSGQPDVNLTATCVNLRAADSYIDADGILHWVFFDCSTSGGAPSCNFRYFDEGELVGTISYDMEAAYVECRDEAINYAQEIANTFTQTAPPPPIEWRVPIDSYWTDESGRVSPSYSLYGPYCLWTGQATIRVLASARIYIETLSGSTWTTWIPGWAYVERYYLTGGVDVFRHRKYNQRLQTFADFYFTYPASSVTTYAVDYGEEVVEDGVSMTRSYSGLSSAVTYTVGEAEIIPDPPLNESGMWSGVSIGKQNNSFVLMDSSASWDASLQVLYHRGWSVDLTSYEVSDLRVPYNGLFVNTRIPLRSNELDQSTAEVMTCETLPGACSDYTTEKCSDY